MMIDGPEDEQEQEPSGRMGKSYLLSARAFLKLLVAGPWQGRSRNHDIPLFLPLLSSPPKRVVRTKRDYKPAASSNVHHTKEPHRGGSPREREPSPRRNCEDEDRRRRKGNGNGQQPSRSDHSNGRSCERESRPDHGNSGHNDEYTPGRNVEYVPRTAFTPPPEQYRRIRERPQRCEIWTVMSKLGVIVLTSCVPCPLQPR